jgi:hypothetical protein
MAPGGTLAWAWEESEVREGNTARRKRARVQEKADGELRELSKDGGRGGRYTEREQRARKMEALLDAVFFPISVYIYRCRKVSWSCSKKLALQPVLTPHPLKLVLKSSHQSN